MDNINLKNMHLAYQAVYNQELREEFEEINEDFLGVDYLTEESLEDISEEVIYEMLDEGYDLSDIESIFEEFILEARVTYGHNTDRPPGRIEKIKGAFKDVLGRVRGAVVQSQGKARESAIQASERASARGAAIKGAVGGLKNKLKDKIGKVVSAAKAGATAVKKEFTGEAEKEAEARKMNRIAQRSAKAKARQMSTLNPFEPKALPPARTTKSGKPFNVGQYQMRSGMQNRKLKQRLGEDLEAWVNELLDEGYDLSDYTWDELGEIYLDEATAMARRGLDEPAIRTQIAKKTGGGQAADRATALADRPTYGQRGVNPQARQRLAAKQRGDFRKTTSSNPGLHGYGYKSNDPEVKAKQAARGAQRGSLTPNEKKELNIEEIDLYDVILSHLLDEGFADTLEGAEAIMVNMSEDWKESIVEERVNLYQPRSATYQRRQGRPSPAVQAMNKSRELQTTEPGSDRQKRQTRAFRRIAGAGTDALRAKEDRVRKGLE